MRGPMGGGDARTCEGYARIDSNREINGEFEVTEASWTDGRVELRAAVMEDTSKVHLTYVGPDDLWVT